MLPFETVQGMQLLATTANLPVYKVAPLHIQTLIAHLSTSNAISTWIEVTGYFCMIQMIMINSF